MRTMSRGWKITLVLLALGAAYLLHVALSPGASAATVTMKVKTYDTPRGIDPCPGASKFRGWLWLEGVEARSGFPTFAHQFTFAKGWGGYWCRLNGAIKETGWGSSPRGQATLPWHWDGNDNKVTFNDQVGPVRTKEWRGHFHSTLGPGIGRHAWPIVRTTVRADGSVSMIGHEGF